VKRLLKHLSPLSLALSVILAFIAAMLIKEFGPPSRGVRMVPLTIILAIAFSIPITLIEGVVRRQKEK
tara:strand:+ start:21650 stop:21853 length:204 start_codon:yes stop_codon:yes gene_type:complete